MPFFLRFHIISYNIEHGHVEAAVPYGWPLVCPCLAVPMGCVSVEVEHRLAFSCIALSTIAFGACGGWAALSTVLAFAFALALALTLGNL